MYNDNNYLDVSSNFSPPLTVSCWGYFNSLSASNQTLINIGASGNNSGLTLVYSGTNIGIAVNINNTIASTYYPISTNTWYNFAITFGSLSVNFYINGSLISTFSTITATFTVGGTKMRLGEDILMGSPLNGTLNDVRVYNRILLSNEILLVYKNSPNLQLVSNALTINTPLTINSTSSTVISTGNATVLPSTSTNSTGLTIWMPFDGSIADCAGGINNNLTVSGAPTFVQGPYGPGSKALNFTASGQHLQVPYTASMYATQTVAIWVNFSSIANSPEVFSILYAGPSVVEQFMLNLSNAGQFGDQINGGVNNIYSPTLIQINTWYHVVRVYTPGVGHYLYINGVLNVSNITTCPTYWTSTPTILNIGDQAGTGGTSQFYGSIADFRIYNYSFNATDVQTLYSTFPNYSLGGAISYFPFDNNNLDYLGTNTLTTIGSVTYVPGRVSNGTTGKAMYIANDSVIGNSPINYLYTPISSLSTSGPLTFSCWLYLPKLNTNIGSNTIPISIGSATNGDGASIFIQGNVNDTSYILVMYNGTTYYTTATTFVPVVNTWYHMVGTWASNLLSFYVNGILINTATTTGTITPSYLVLGYRSSGAWSGYIDDLRIYNRSLPAQEIANLYYANQNQNIIVNFPFESNLNDSTGNNNILNTIGSITYSNSIFKQGNNSLKLNNTTCVTSTPTKATNYLTSTSIPFYTGTNPVSYSIVCWFYITTLPNITGPQKSTIWSVGTATAGGETFSIYITGGASPVISLSLNNNTYSCSTTAGTPTITTSTWYHLVGTFDKAGNSNIYINGGTTGTYNATVAQGSTVNLNTISILTLGESCDISLNRPFDGYIDDFKVYNRLLNIGEIGILAGTNNSSLTQYFPFDSNLNNSISGGYTFSTSGTPPQLSPGIFGNCLNFSTSNSVNTQGLSYLTTNSNFTSITGPITVSCWIYPTTAGTYSFPWAFENSTSNDILKLGWAGSSYIFAQIATGGNSTSTGSTNISVNTWYHTTVVYNPGVILALYINGIVNGTTLTTTATALGTSTALVLGYSSVTSATYAYVGLLDDFRIYNRVLSALEIQQLYFAGLPQVSYPITTINPVIYYPFIKDYNDYSTLGSFTTQIVGNIQYVPGIISSSGYSNISSAIYFANESNVIATPTAKLNYLNINFILSTVTTISCWIYITKMSLGSNCCIYACGTTANNGFFINLSSAGTISVNANAIGGSTTASTVINTWYHLVTVINLPSSNISSYLNAIPYTSTTNGAANYQATGLITLGDTTMTSAIQPFAGYIDDFRIYNYAMTAAQITTLYNSYSPPSFNSYILPTTYPSTNIVNGLIAWYKFENNVNDYSLNGNSLINTSTTYNSSIFKAGTYSLYFNNTTAGSTATAYSDLAVANNIPINKFTVSLWIYFTTTAISGIQSILNIGATNTITGLQIGLTTTNTLTIYYNAQTLTALVLPTSTWTNIIITQTPTTLTLYINGSSLATLTLTTSYITNVTALRLGADLTTGHVNAYAGLIDDLRIYNRVLSTIEITNLYSLYSLTTVTASQLAITNNANSLVASGLQCYLPFDGNSLDVTNLSTTSLTYGSTPVLTTPAISTVKYVTPSRVGNSCLYLNNTIPPQNHIDISLSSITGSLSISNWFLALKPGGLSTTIYNVASTTSSNGIIVGLSNNLRSWPPIAPLITVASSVTAAPSSTGTITGSLYGNGTYYFKASNIYNTGNGPEFAFNKNDVINAVRFMSPTNYSAAGAYTGGTASGYGTYYGEWLQIQLPQPIILYSYSITNCDTINHYPSTFNVYGSNDGTTFTLIDGYTAFTSWPATLCTPYMFTLSTIPIAYSYFRIVINKSINTTVTTISEWILYEYTNTLSSNLTLAAAPTGSSNIVIPSITNNITNITYGNWYNSIVTFDGFNIRLYLNGVLTFNSVISLNATSIVNTSMIRIGDLTTNSTSIFNGYLSDFRVYNRVLTSTEINSLFTIPQTLTVPTSALLGWWQFENNLTDTTNGWTSTTFGLATYVAGNVGSYALSLVNTPGKIATNYIDISLSVICPNSYSFSFWIKPTSFTDSNGPVNGLPSCVLALAGMTTTLFGKTLEFYLTSSGIPQLNYIDINNIVTTFNGTSITSITNWSHIVIIWSGYNVSLYVNNVLIVTSNTSIIKPSICNKIRLGDGLTSGNSYNGAIDDLRWYNHILSTNEIATLYSNKYSSIVYNNGLTVNGNTTISGNLYVSGSTTTVNTATLFSGSGASLSSLNASNVNTGTLAVLNGGTGITNITANSLLIGNGVNSIVASNNLIYTNNSLGIGKTPTYNLDVSGNLNLTGTIYQNGTAFPGTAGSTILSVPTMVSFTSGTGTWTVPAGITQIQVELVGGGGGGGTCTGQNSAGGGGAGGYIRAILSVSGGYIINYTIAAASAQTVNSSALAGTTGNNSTLSITGISGVITAVGGTGGYPENGIRNGQGGAGGVPTNTIANTTILSSILINGGYGTSGSEGIGNVSYGTGGLGGSSYFGSGGAGSTTAYNAITGVVPGSGGGGGCGGVGANNIPGYGAGGAGGILIISYNAPSGINNVYTVASPLTLTGTQVGLSTVNVATGGTGTTTLTANSLLIGNGSNAIITPSNLQYDNTNNIFTANSAMKIGGTITSLNNQTYQAVDMGLYQMSIAGGTVGSVPTNSTYTPFNSLLNEGSLSFNGSISNYILMYNNAISTYVWGTSSTPITIECWAYFNAFGSSGTPQYNLNLIGCGLLNWSFGATSSGTISLYYYNTGAALTYVTSTQTVSLNTWYHLAITCDTSSYIRIFINGTLVISPTIIVGTLATGPGPLTIGFSGVPGQTATHNGYITNLRVVSSSCLYTGSTNGTNYYTPSTSPLTVASSGTTAFLLRVPLNPGKMLVSKIGGTTGIQAYPPCALTGYVTNLTGQTSYGQGYYIITSSNDCGPGTYSYFAFDKNTATYWQTPNADYSASSPYAYVGSVSTIDTLGNIYLGDWVQLQLPVSIILTSYTFTCWSTTNNASTWYILGSKDGINWNLINMQTGITWVGTSPANAQTFTVSTSTAYNYYRKVLYKSAGTGTGILVPEWLLYGTQESINMNTDGKVGLGVVNPYQALEVAGNAIFSGNIAAGNIGIFRNRVINGSMFINQRGITSAVLSNGGTTTYYADRFSICASIITGGLTISQNTLIASDTPYMYGFRKSFKVLASTACSSYNYINGPQQYIEGYNIIDFNWGTSFGSPITISFWFRTNIAAGSNVSIKVCNCGATSWINWYTTFTVAAASVWQYVTTVVPPPPSGSTWNNDNTGGILLSIVDGQAGTGQASTINSWISGNTNGLTSSFVTAMYGTINNYCEITGLQLEKGTIATPFEFRPFPIELQLCQRYYQTSYSYGIAPGTTYVNGTYGQFSSNANVMWSVIYPVTLRITPGAGTTTLPSLRIYAPNSGTIDNFSCGGGSTNYAITYNSCTEKSFNVYGNNNAQVNNFMYIHFVVNTEL